MTSKTNYLGYFIAFFIMAALILVPSYYTTEIHNAFTIEKHFIFRLCALVLVGLTTAKVIYQPQKIKFPIVFWLLPLFWLVGLGSTIFAIAPQVSLWGIHLRMDGLVPLTFLIVFGILVYLYVDSRKKLEHILWAILAGSVIVVIYALAQKFGLDSNNWKEVNAAERIFGTTGNPAYLGAYLLFTIPICFYLAVKQKNPTRYLLFTFFGLQILTLVYTWTRAAYVGLFVELFILFVGYFYFHNQKKWAVGLSAVYIIFILFIASLNIFPGFADMFSGNRYINRLSELTQIDEGTGKDRLEMWKIAGQAIKENPLLGTGLTSYYYHFNLNYPNYMDGRSEDDRYSNYPHNMILDYGVSHGLLGIVVFLLLIFSTIVYLFRKIPEQAEPDQKILYLILATALLGYFCQSIFNIDTIITWVYFYGFIGLSMAAVSSIDNQREKIAANISIFKQILVTLVAVAGIVAIYYLAYAPLVADIEYVTVNYNPKASTDTKTTKAQNALELTPYYEYSHMKLSDMYLAQIDYNQPEQVSGHYQNAIDQIQTAIKINPNNYKNYLSLGLVYGHWSKTDPTKLTLAEESLQEAKELSPNRLGLHYNWGNMYIDLGLLDKAQEQFELAQDLNPDIGETYFHFAKIAFLRGENTKGQEYIQQAVQLGYDINQLGMYQKLAITAYNSFDLSIASTLASTANKIQLTENTALLEIQTYLDLSLPTLAKQKSLEYIEKLPELSEKLQGVIN
ncbi:O-antigen ligase family protein [Patescibacteria group bacterium]|nr:O-antigen ligase family protein [Patescibacteria group bacterium]